MDLVYWASHSSKCLADTEHVRENRLVTYYFSYCNADELKKTLTVHSFELLLLP